MSGRYRPLRQAWRPLSIAGVIAVLPLFAFASDRSGSTGPLTIVVGQRRFEVTLHYSGSGDPPFYERTWAEVTSGPNQTAPTGEERQTAVELSMLEIAGSPVHWGRLGPERRVVHWARLAGQILPSSVLALIVLGVWVAYDFRRMNHRRQPGHCSNCGYDLAGINGPCPECGAAG